jgi:hypothetical protein
MSARENFSEFCYRENFKTYYVVLSLRKNSHIQSVQWNVCGTFPAVICWSKNWRKLRLKRRALEIASWTA